MSTIHTSGGNHRHVIRYGSDSQTCQQACQDNMNGMWDGSSKSYEADYARCYSAGDLPNNKTLSLDGININPALVSNFQNVINCGGLPYFTYNILAT